MPPHNDKSQSLVLQYALPIWLFDIVKFTQYKTLHWEFGSSLVTFGPIFNPLRGFSVTIAFQLI